MYQGYTAGWLGRRGRHQLKENSPNHFQSYSKPNWKKKPLKKESVTDVFNRLEYFISI